MSVRFPNIVSAIQKFSSTSKILNYANAAGIGVVSGVPYINTGSLQTLADFLQTPTTNVGAKNGSTVSVVETGFGGLLHKSVFTLTATPMTVADATAGGGVKIYTFPEGAITLLGRKFSLIPTT